jgi:hypothetical protein
MTNTDPTGRSVTGASCIDPAGRIETNCGTSSLGSLLGGSAVGTSLLGLACAGGLLDPLEAESCAPFAAAAFGTGGGATAADTYNAATGRGSIWAVPLDLMGLGAGPLGKIFDKLLVDAPGAAHEVEYLGDIFGAVAGIFSFAGGVALQC